MYTICVCLLCPSVCFHSLLCVCVCFCIRPSVRPSVLMPVFRSILLCVKVCFPGETVSATSRGCNNEGKEAAWKSQGQPSCFRRFKSNVQTPRMLYDPDSHGYHAAAKMDNRKRTSNNIKYLQTTV